MKIVLQRVLRADVTVENKIVSEIGPGLLILLGITGTDTKSNIEVLVNKVARLCIFPDEHGKTNLSIADIGGEVLVVSQFTLYADTRKGNRPSFTEAAPPEQARQLYEYFLECCNGKFAKVAGGSFGAQMQIGLINDGPFTVVMEY